MLMPIGLLVADCDIHCDSYNAVIVVKELESVCSTTVYMRLF